MMVIAGLTSLVMMWFTLHSDNTILQAANAMVLAGCVGAFSCQSFLVFGIRPVRMVASTPSEPANFLKPQPVDLLDNKRWVGLVEECIVLLDELEQHRSKLDPGARELGDHVDLRLQEILERSGVTVIIDETTFDRSRHQVEPGTAVERPEAAIVETLRPGLAVGRRILRRARVRVATEGTQPEGEPSS
jgi:hypothetical protein